MLERGFPPILPSSDRCFGNAASAPIILVYDFTSFVQSPTWASSCWSFTRGTRKRQECSAV